MSIIIRLQNLPWSANSVDIRRYFSGLSIPEGGVHIVGGEMGDAFIAFSTDEDARLAMAKDGGKIKDMQIKLLLSSRTEMMRVIEQARQQNVVVTQPHIVATQPPILSLQQPSRITTPTVEPERRRARSPVRSPPHHRSRDRSPVRDRRRSPDDRRSSKRDRSRSPARSSRSFSRDLDRRSDRYKRDDRRYDDSRYRDERRSTRDSSGESKKYPDADHVNSRSQLHATEGFRDIQPVYNQVQNTAMSGVYQYGSQQSQPPVKSFVDSYSRPLSNSASQLSQAEHIIAQKPLEVKPVEQKYPSSAMYPHEQVPFRSTPFEPSVVSSKETSTLSTQQEIKPHRRSRFEPPDFVPSSIQPPFIAPESNANISNVESQRGSTVYNVERHPHENYSEGRSTWPLGMTNRPENVAWNEKRQPLLNPPLSNTGDFLQVVPMDLDPPSEMSPKHDIYNENAPSRGSFPYTRNNASPRKDDLRENQNRGPLMHNDNQNRGPLMHNDNQNRGPLMHNDNQNRGSLMHANQNRGPPITDNQTRGSPMTDNQNRVPMMADNQTMGPPMIDKQNRGPPIHNNPNMSHSIHENQNRGPPMHENKNRGLSLHDNQNRGPSLHDHQNRGPSLHDNQNRGPQIHDNQNRRPPIHDNHNRRPPIHDNQNRRGPIQDNQSRGPLMHDNQVRGPPIQDNQNRRPPMPDNQNRRPPMPENQNMGPPMTDNQNRRPPMPENQNIGPPTTDNQNRGPLVHGDNQIKVPTSLTVEVRGLPPDARIDDVLDLFHGISLPAANIRIEASEQGFEKAFIRFTSAADFEEALSRNRRFIHEGRCELVPCPATAFDSAQSTQKSKLKPKPREEDLVIQMRGLPFVCKDDDIVKFFDGLAILDLFIEYAPDGRATGNGFVELGSNKDFRTALAMNGKMIGHRYITVSVASKEMMIAVRGEDYIPKDSHSNEPHSTNSCPPHSPLKQEQPQPIPNIPPQSNPNRPSPSNSNRPPPSNPIRPPPSNPSRPPPSNPSRPPPSNPNRPPVTQERQPPSCIFMKGLPEGVTNRDIADFLGQVLVMPRAIHIMLRPDKMPSGDAYAEFATLEDMETALEMSGKLVAGNCVLVEPISFYEMSDILGRPVTLPPPPTPSGLLQTPAEMERPRRSLLCQGPGEAPYRERPRMERPIRGGRLLLDPFNKNMDGPMGRPTFGLSRMRGPWPNRPRQEGRFPPPPGERGPKDFGLPGCVVSINNLHFRAGLEELLDFFHGYNITKDNVIRKYNENGQTTGEARVSFQNPRDAQRVVRELNQKPIMGRPLVLSVL